MELYTWQKECLEAWEQNQYHGIVQVVTGAGKTIMAIHAVLKLQKETEHPFRVRIVVPTNAIASQWKKQLLNIIPSCTKVGMYGGGLYDDPSQDYMIYIINSARYNLSRHILEDQKYGYGTFLICDECHHYGSKENRKIFEFLHHIDQNNYYSLALSATPAIKDPEGRSIIKNALGDVIYRYGFTQASKHGTVCSFVVFQTRISLAPDEADKYAKLTNTIISITPKLYKAYPLLKHAGNDFFILLQSYVEEEDGEGIASQYSQLVKSRREIVLFAEERFSCTIALLKNLAPNEKIIIFSERISQAEELLKKLKEEHFNHVSHYHSELTPEARKRNLEDFKNGTNRILVCCKGLDEGADIPEASIAIVLSGTNTSRQRIQRLGRILRTHPDKSIASLYYLYIGNANEDPAYLPDTTDESFSICHLYHCDDSFIHNAYENTCIYLLKHLRRNNKLMKEFLEFRSCMNEGAIRSDWLLSEEECKRKCKNASSTHEANYWKTMAALSVIREQISEKSSENTDEFFI